MVFIILLDIKASLIKSEQYCRATKVLLITANCDDHSIILLTANTETDKPNFRATELPTYPKLVRV